MEEVSINSTNWYGCVAQLAINLKLRRMDAIVVQVAKEKKAALITFDEETAERLRQQSIILTPNARAREY